MSHPTTALRPPQPTHLTPIRLPASRWQTAHLKLETVLKERRSNRSNQDQELEELVSQQNIQAIHTHTQSVKSLFGQIRLQLSSLERSDNNVKDIVMNIESLEYGVDLIIRICEDNQEIRNFRDLEKHYRDMADQKIGTMTSRRPIPPPPSFPQPQQPKDGAEESEASDSEQEHEEPDAISGGKQKDGEASPLATDGAWECPLFGQEYRSACGSDHLGSGDNGFILVP